ncbi:hypothetical protein SDC9_46846 [bioreactor metagenome]|uniref:Uncharacterized protein n=1 Tax=bioreactor metagenome TaxID=1076179 RepID=A0A644WAL5_9ZZZZ
MKEQAIDERDNRDEIRKIDILLRIYCGVDPAVLSDDEWASMYKSLRWAIDNHHPIVFNTNVTQS